MKLIKTVDLVFFEDDASGNWGLAHKETYNENNAFNAFWNGIGVFHDVFEHYFENKHKYFKGDYGMNVGGEMVASGHMWYYRNKLGMYNMRLQDGYQTTASKKMIDNTSDLVQEAICSGYANYGSKLESNIPKQSPADDYDLEDELSNFWQDVKSWNFRNDYYDERKYSETYKKSISFKKIVDLHRWGFKQEEKYVPDNYENKDVLCNFIEFWDKFCKNNNPKNIASYCKGITIKVYKNKDVISWKAFLIPQYGTGLKTTQITHSYEIEY